MKDVLSRLTTIEAKTNDRIKKLEVNASFLFSLQLMLISLTYRTT